jgi:hypothetical protein
MKRIKKIYIYIYSNLAFGNSSNLRIPNGSLWLFALADSQNVSSTTRSVIPSLIIGPVNHSIPSKTKHNPSPPQEQLSVTRIHKERESECTCV